MVCDPGHQIIFSYNFRGMRPFYVQQDGKKVVLTADLPLEQKTDIETSIRENAAVIAEGPFPFVKGTYFGGHRICGKSLKLIQLRVAHPNGTCGTADERNKFAMCPGPKNNRMCIKITDDEKKHLAKTLEEKCPITNMKIIKAEDKAKET